MGIELRTPSDDDWTAISQFDGRTFGATYTAEEVERQRPMHDMSRFRVAHDGRQIVGVAGSYELDATLPGRQVVRMGGVTWVGVAATHRRRGVMRRLIGAVHDDIDAREEPLASLYGSEGGIYHHVGYGTATQVRVTSIDVRTAAMRPEFEPAPGSVRYVDSDDLVPTLERIWTRFRSRRAGEIGRSRADHEYFVASGVTERDGYSAVAYLAHRDGYAAYRTKMQWNDGHPAHTVAVSEVAAATSDAHAALWYTLLNLDLVGTITSRSIAIDDPLPMMLQNPRSLRTTNLNDGVWLNVRDVPSCFGARTYRTAERFVVQVDDARWAIDGGPDGASCTRVKSRPDLVTSHGPFSALLYGGVLPSALVAGGRMNARRADALERADVFFTTSLAPHCQSLY
jgi:predicted acetyltransferase